MNSQKAYQAGQADAKSGKGPTNTNNMPSQIRETYTAGYGQDKKSSQRLASSDGEGLVRAHCLTATLDSRYKRAFNALIVRWRFSMLLINDCVLVDLKSRERIRHRVQRFQLEYGLGVPALAEVISRALPRRPAIPVKSLQRFLEGNQRTNDMLVGFLKQFVDGLRQEVSNPLHDLGMTLERAFGSHAYRKDMPGFTGTYMLTSSVAHSSEVIIEWDEGRSLGRIVENADSGAHYEGVIIESAVSGSPTMAAK